MTWFSGRVSSSFQFQRYGVGLKPYALVPVERAIIVARPDIAASMYAITAARKVI